MNKIMAAAVLACLLAANALAAGPLKFEKLTDHCYYLQLKSGENVFAVVVDDGILLVDPPSEPDLTITLEALKRFGARTVRWIAFSHPQAILSEGARFFSEKGAVLLAGTQLRSVSISLSGSAAASASPSHPWLVYDNQIRLFPSNLEIRITALQKKARTGGDAVVFVPAEKVLYMGALYEPGRYPETDSAAQGSAVEWVDGVKQIIDSVPVLKAAIPSVKPAAKQTPEKTPEESIVVIPGHGPLSNYQNLKDLLSASQKLRADVLRYVKSGRTCENLLDSGRFEPYKNFSNLEIYAGRLCQEIRDSSPEIRD